MNPTLYEQYRALLRLRIAVAQAEASAAKAIINRMDRK
jgi:hypothetical protein